MHVNHWELIIFLLNIISTVVYNFNLNTKEAKTFSLTREINSRNYFGFSVLLQTGDYPSIVVGSPKSNSSYKAHANIKEPGTVYRCWINNQTCSQYVINEEGNSQILDNANGHTYYQKKDGAFIGGSIDGSVRTDGPLIVCGHRWINIRHVIQSGDIYLANGICYLLQNSLNLNENGHKLIPLLNPGKQGFQIDEKHYYYYAMGQAGMSIKYSEKNQEIVMGAPGIINWKGACIKYSKEEEINIPLNKRRRQTRIANFNSPDDIQNPLFNTRLQNTNNSYFGYVVSSGTFVRNSSKTWYVSGAPRGHNFHGQVFVFEFQKTEESDLIFHAELRGDQLGSNFGSSLLVIDLNKDGADDLIVGAPIYTTNKWDEGCAYLYMNNGQGAFKESQKIFGISQTGSRFGTAISDLGDLNGDGYPDVAISAPYEDDGRGTIYIYLGTSHGLRKSFSQRIFAKTIDENIRAFGYSLSRGVDVDWNNYNDLAIGAYKSGHVVLLRSQPVVKFNSTILSTVSEISINVDRFSVKYCISFHSKLFVEPFEILANFSHQANNEISPQNITNNTFTLSTNNPKYCSNYSIIRIKNNADRSVPIVIRIEYEIKNTDCIHCPMTDPEDKNYSFLTIPYANGCGDDNMCQYDLSVSVAFNPPMDRLIIGSRNKIQIVAKIRNNNEPAYLTTMYVQIPKNVDLGKMPKKCKYASYLLECNVDNPLMPNKEKSITIELDLKKLRGNDQMLAFNISATASGHDINVDNNQASLYLNLDREAMISIEGSSTPNQLIYRDDDGKLHNKVKFSQDFAIQNLGPSPVDKLEIDFYLPISIRRNEQKFKEVLMQIYEPIGYMDEQSIQCSSEEADPFYAETLDGKATDVFENNKIKEKRRKKRNEDSDMGRIPENMALNKNYPVHDLPQNRTLYINCSSENFKIECLHVRCVSGQLTNLRQIISVSFALISDFEVIEKYLGKKDIVLYTTLSTVTVNDKTAEKFVNTIMLGKLIDETVPIWIYILGILLGLLVIAGIVAGLWKFGFFKRTKKNELIEALLIENENYGFINPTANEARNID